MTVSGLYFPLPRPVLPTGAIDGGALDSVPTPTATDSKGSRRATARRDGWKSNSGTTLTDFVTLYPTPTATDYGSNKSPSKGAARRMSLGTMARKNEWPTPKASDWKRQGSPAELRRNSPDLPAVAGGKLNPQWVEWLMGVPVGWTDSRPLEMGKCPHNSFWLGIISGPKPEHGGSSDE